MNILVKLLCFQIMFNDLVQATNMKFITDFVNEENSTLIVHSCWLKGEAHSFLKEIQTLINRKFISIQQDIADFLIYSGNSNWFMINFTQCGNISSVLGYLNDNDFFYSPSKSLFLIEQELSDMFFTEIENCNILPMSQVMVAVFKSDIWADLFQPFKYAPNGKMFNEYTGNWSKTTGISYTYKYVPLVERRLNFQRFELVVGSVIGNKKRLHANFDDVSESDILSEPFFFQDFPIIYFLIQFLNASYTFRIFDSYGYLNNATGKFDGLVRDLVDGNSHITGTSFIVSEERQKAVEFINRVNQHGTKFILKKPPFAYIENIFLTTFTTKVWIACAVILLIYCTILYGLLNWESKSDLLPQEKGPVKCTVSDIILFSLEAVCQQGTFTDSKTYTGRILILILFMAFMFLYVSYSAFIIVLLQSTKPISSIKELINSRIDSGGANISYLMTYYESTKDESLKELYRKKVCHNKFVSLEDGLKRVQEGNFAFQAPLANAYNFILKTYTNVDICKLQELPGYMNADNYFSAPKTSQYKEYFRVGLIRVDEVGLQIRNKNRVSVKPKCYNAAGNFQSVRIFDCHSLFVLYLIGIMLSLLILMMELLIFKYAARKTLFVNKIEVDPIDNITSAKFKYID